MLPQIRCFSMLLVSISVIFWLSSAVGGCDDYEDISDGDAYEDYAENYNDGDEETTTSSYEDSTINRVRRNDLKSSIKTLGPDDVREVRGAIKELLSGIAVENPFTPFTTMSYTDYRPTHSSITNSTSAYDTSLPANTTSSTITPTYLSNLFTEIFEFTNFTNFQPTRSREHLKYKLVELDKKLYGRRGGATLSKYLRDDKQTTNNDNITTPNTTKRLDLDIPRLLAIISELANEFETNLTRKLNETLINMTLPTCTTPTLEPPVTSEYDANFTGSIVAKCYVCGLDIPAIPHNAYCADAFAGDFLPLVPVDPTAKGQISTFKKYCKYTNVPGYEYNETQPRVILGRWTGGCAVRWIDLSGVYTQRTCRNRIHPTMGQHFGSKRMAKLERTLWNVDNGCISSPMATLVPLSRGVSLYSRFHACVCTGSFCNPSSLITPCFVIIITISSLLCVYH